MSVTITNNKITPGTGATNLGKAEDGAHATGDVGVMSLAVRNDSSTAISGATGDYNPLQVNAIGELRTATGGYMVRVTTSKTRPNNTDAYTSGDVINESTSAGTNWTFANCSRINAGSGVITRATIADGANVSTKAILELWLFNASPTADMDAALFTPTDAELATCFGIIQFTNVFVGDATSGASGNCVLSSGQIAVPFLTGAATKDIYGVLVVRNAYVPVANETFDIILSISQD